MTENLSSLVAAPAGFRPLVSVVHAEPTPSQNATLTLTASTTKPLTSSDMTSSTAAPLTGYTGRYTQPDPLGLGAGSTPYSYADDNSIRGVDPDGLYTFIGPPGKAGDVELAVSHVQDSLTKTCCAGQKGGPLLSLLADPNLTIEFKETLKPCGYTPLLSVIGLGRKIQIGPKAWNCCFGGSPSGIDSLASTILHEISHIGFGSGSAAEAVERKCFGCGKTDYGLPPLPIRPLPGTQ
jgi:hypothetical protein